MRTIKLALCLIAVALAMSGAVKVRSRGTFGPRGGFQGSTVHISPAIDWADVYAASADTETNDLLVPGTDLAVGINIWFLPESGTLPTYINRRMPYTICSKSAPGVYKIGLDSSFAAGCVPISFGGNGGSGSWAVGRMYGSSNPPGADHLYLKNITLPAGVSIAGCAQNGRWYEPPCALASSPAEYWSYAATNQLWFELEISPTAPTGDHTISFTWYCRTSGIPDGCADTVVSIPFKIEALIPLTRSRPTSFPAVPTKASWESQLLTAYGKWCTDDNGTVSYAGDSTLSFGSDIQVWYYDGAWALYWLHEYTGNPKWKKCADTIARDYRTEMIGRNGAGSVFNKYFFRGLHRSVRDYDMRGRRAVDLILSGLPPGLGQAEGLVGSPSDPGIRSTAYALELAITAAEMRGWRKFHYIADPVLKGRVKRMADLLLQNIYQNIGDDYDYWQSFMAGIAQRAAILWYEYSGDERAPVLVKRALDLMMSPALYGQNPTFPNDIAWMRGVAAPGSIIGPHCVGNCFPTPSGFLVGMILPAYAWLWQHTGDDTYRIFGDTVWTSYLTTPEWDLDWNGKITNESFGWWSEAYVAWREGRTPARP